jgi:hypothetical protein
VPRASRQQVLDFWRFTCTQQALPHRQLATATAQQKKETFFSVQKSKMKKKGKQERKQEEKGERAREGEEKGRESKDNVQIPIAQSHMYQCQNVWFIFTA